MRELSLLAAAREVPDRDCLITNDQVWSYAEVAGRVHAAIASLRNRGVATGDRVALTPGLDVDSMVWLYALFEVGCPALLLHPRLTERERSVLLIEADPAHVIAERPVVDEANDEGSTAVSRSPDETLAVVYTSGSSARARGARLSRRAFLASEAAHAANLGWRTGDRWLLGMPPAHVGGLSVVTRSLIARRCIVLSSGNFEPAEASRVMAEHRVTLCSMVPTMLRRLLEHDEPAWTPSADLRAVLVGGAPFSDTLRELAVNRGVPVLATYGCTEACSQIATQSPQQVGSTGSGAPLKGVELRLEGGEVQVRGDVLMDGYLDEGRTGAAWTAEGWFRTGDAGSFLPDGQLSIEGRLDDLIITGGENVSPQEVEAWLETVPGVLSACVFGIPDAEWGSEVVAALVTDPVLYCAQTLRARLLTELAVHKRPKRVCLRGELPVNRNGKVDRVAVTQACAAELRPI